MDAKVILIGHFGEDENETDLLQSAEFSPQELCPCYGEEKSLADRGNYPADLTADQATGKMKPIAYIFLQEDLVPETLFFWVLILKHMKVLLPPLLPARENGLTLSLTSSGHRFSLRNFKVSTWPCREAQ